MDCGAHDGKFLSNTLDSESKFNWSGILIVGKSEVFKKLLTRNRKSWALPICLSLEPYRIQLYNKYQDCSCDATKASWNSTPLFKFSTENKKNFIHIEGAVIVDKTHKLFATHRWVFQTLNRDILYERCYIFPLDSRVIVFIFINRPGQMYQKQNLSLRT